MSHFPPVLVSAVLALFMLRGVTGTALEPGDNAEHYGILCRIYKVAASPPTNISNEKLVNEITTEVDAFNASLSDDTWFDEVAKSTGATMPEELKLKYPGTAGLWQRWKEAVNQVQSNGVFVKLPSSSTAVKVAQIKMRGIEGQMDKVLNDIGRKVTEAKLETIKQKFDDAIYGQERVPNQQFKGDSDRQTTCGKATGSSAANAGTSAGKSLILDFLCLCAHGGGNGQHTICGGHVDVTGATAWSTSADDGSNKGEANWKIIREGCGANSSYVYGTGTVRAARETLRKFKEKISAGAVTTSTTRLPGVFGSTGGSWTSAGCDGDKRNADHGVCVYYGAKNDWDNLNWVKNINDGLFLLDSAEAAALVIQQDLALLKMLRARAGEIYEETKLNLEGHKGDGESPTQNPSRKQVLTNQSDKATAQEPDTMSSAPRKHFILPWTLLI